MSSTTFNIALTVVSGSTTDPNAVHTQTANEISALTEKTTLSDNDLIIIEDSEASYVKKKAKKSNVGGSGGAGTGDVTSSSALTDNAIVRGDGGAKGVQTSLVYIDDSGNLGVKYATPISMAAGGRCFVLGDGSDNPGMTLYSSSGGTGSIFFTDTEGTKQGYIQFNQSTETFNVGFSETKFSLTNALATFNVPFKFITDSVNLLSDNTTDATYKSSRIGLIHYTTSEEPVAFAFLQSYDTYSNVIIGGGSSIMNAATNVSFYTASNNTTTTGTKRLEIKSTGESVFYGNTKIVYSGVGLLGTSVETDATNKDFRIACSHYTNSEEPFGGLLLFAQSGNNNLYLGGGSSVVNAATTINLNVATDTTTTTGTTRFQLNGLGQVFLHTADTSTPNIFGMSSITGNNNKQFSICSSVYASAGITKFSVIGSSSTVSAQIINIGGYAAGGYAATAINLYTASTLTEASPTARLSIDSTGAVTIATSLQINSTVTLDGFLDEDDMVSDSATKGATQQSIKKYVDDNIAAGGMTSFLVTGDSGTPETITNGQTITFAGGIGVSTTVSATDTITINADVGIADTKLVKIDSATVADNDYAKFTANGLEGRSYAEVRTDLNVADGADVTNATTVNAAGATMNSDTDLTGNGYFLDEDDMVSDSATKVPSQQSVKYYCDNNFAPVAKGVTNGDSHNHSGGDGAVIPAASIEVSEIGTATYDDLQNFISIMSAGVLTGGTITDNTDGSVTAAAGTGKIATTNSEMASHVMFDWSQNSNVTLTDNTTNFVYVDYNAGSPQIVSTTSITNLNFRTHIVIGVVTREGTDLHIINAKQYLEDFQVKMFLRQLRLKPLEKASGAVVTETGTRNIVVTEGNYYYVLNYIQTDSFDSSGVDTFRYFYRDGASGWTQVTAQTQINNTQYDNNSGTLATLTANRYGVHWVFAVLDDTDNGHIHLLFGQGDYTLAEAQAVSVPTTLPTEIVSVGTIIAKIIIQKDASSFTSLVNISNGVTFSAATDHGALGGLTDDDHTQYLLANGSRAYTSQVITDNAIATIDDADAESGDYAKFTTNGLEGRSVTEVKSDLSLSNVANVNTTVGTIGITIDGGGSAITTGVKGDIRVPFACTITDYEILADQTGSIQIDVWKDTYANFPPTDADSITAAAPVVISSATKANDTSLTGWSTSLSAGDILRFNVDSVSTITRVNLSMKVTKV